MVQSLRALWQLRRCVCASVSLNSWLELRSVCKWCLELVADEESVLILSCEMSLMRRKGLHAWSSSSLKSRSSGPGSHHISIRILVVRAASSCTKLTNTLRSPQRTQTAECCIRFRSTARVQLLPSLVSTSELSRPTHSVGAIISTFSVEYSETPRAVSRCLLRRLGWLSYMGIKRWSVWARDYSNV